MNQTVTDWRDQPVEVGTKVIYHRNHSGIATWGIGKVTRVHPGSYGRAWVDIDWEEHSANSMQARGVSVAHLTVWHSLKNQLTEFVEISDYLDDQAIY